MKCVLPIPGMPTGIRTITMLSWDLAFGSVSFGSVVLTTTSGFTCSILFGSGTLTATSGLTCSITFGSG